MKVVRARDHKRTPWKNGGGSTVEICRDEGDGLDGFGWRLSIADIAEAGPFSAFVGYERVITVLEGQGMVLTVDGLDTAPLQAFQPFAFSGASHVSCTLVDGPIRDFNLIYSPARYRARLQWLDVMQPQRFFSSADVFLVFSTAEQMAANIGEHPRQLLEQHDCLQLDNAPGALVEAVLYAPRASRVCVIELSRV